MYTTSMTNVCTLNGMRTYRHELQSVVYCRFTEWARVKTHGFLPLRVY